MSKRLVLKSFFIATALATANIAFAASRDEGVVVVVRVFATPGRADVLQALYLKRLEYFRKAEPEASFRLHRSTKDPNTFLWYEVYPSQTAYENHVKVINENYKKETGPTPAGILARPSESESFSELER